MKVNISVILTGAAAIGLFLASVLFCLIWDRPDLSFFSTCGLFYMTLPKKE